MTQFFTLVSIICLFDIVIPVENDKDPRKQPKDFKKGRNNKMKCWFPFLYKDVLYYECTTVDSIKPWCSLYKVYTENEWVSCDENCPKNFKQGNRNNCYMVSKKAVDWYTAVEICKSNSAVLTSILSPHEMIQVAEVDYRSKSPPLTNKKSIPRIYTWVGSMYEDPKPSVWLDGSKVHIDMYEIMIEHTKPRCLAIYNDTRLNRNAAGGWLATGCLQLAPFVCKIHTGPNSKNPTYPEVKREPSIVTTEYSIPECVFPFTYKKVTYDECTTVDSNMPWCSMNTEYVENEWYSCLKNCPTHFIRGHRNNCYLPIDEPKTLMEGKKICKQNSAILTTAVSKEERAYLVTLYSGFFWVDSTNGTELPKWSSMQSQCLGLTRNLDKDKPAGGIWDYFGCDWTSRFVCKIHTGPNSLHSSYPATLITTTTMQPTTTTIEPTSTTVEPTKATMKPRTPEMKPTTSTYQHTTKSDDLTCVWKKISDYSTYASVTNLIVLLILSSISIAVNVVFCIKKYIKQPPIGMIKKFKKDPSIKMTSFLAEEMEDDE